MAKLALGADFGTNSARVLVVDTETGQELGTGVADYQRGEKGVFLDPNDPHLARQHPQDYCDSFLTAAKEALKEADKSQIVGIGTDTTGSTPIPVDEQNIPLAFNIDDLAAMAWLWKDHTSYAEAREITEKAQSEPYLAKCGGTYSSEWYWSKILHCARTVPRVFERAHSWVEAQDWIPAWLTGINDSTHIKRGICAAGHKAMFHADWGGLPSDDFLMRLDPRLKRYYDTTHPIGEQAGILDKAIADNLGIPQIPVSVGAMDAHLGAVGSGVKPGTMVKIMGTSTCDIMVGGTDTPDIPGVCGVVPGSVIPGMVGIEAGQSAVGDLFDWCARLVGEDQKALNEQATTLRPGESGLLALDWNNGNRTVLVDPLLTGLIVGQTLATTPAEIYRATIEATAFGARRIIDQIRNYGVDVKQIVVCGGIAEKSPLTMQIYADVCNMPMKTTRSAQTCALGAAIAGSVAGGAHPDVLTAIGAMAGEGARVYTPEPAAAATYERLYKLYISLHDSFGVSGNREDLSSVMKELIAIKRSST